MKHWQEDYLNRTRQHVNPEDLFAAAAEAVWQMGFEFCCFGIRMPLPVAEPPAAIYSNYGELWKARYIANNYINVDPTVRHGMQTLRPFAWAGAIKQEAASFWEEASAHGIRYGAAQASRDHLRTFALLSVARSHEPVTESEMALVAPGLTWLAQTVHGEMTPKLLPDMMPNSQVVLTGREQEVLGWTADGKTAHEIAALLHISERTVVFHLANIMAKFGVTNKIQAVARAIMTGTLG